MLQIFPFRVLKHEDLPFQTDPEAEALRFQNVEIETPGTETQTKVSGYQDASHHSCCFF